MKAPPTYSPEEAPPPSFNDFPGRYTVNNNLANPFVSVATLKQHLRLLGAFRALKERVQNARVGITAHLQQEARWGVFVAIALHRFEIWLERVIPVHAKRTELPPLDVALILHAYALNPKWFQEDKTRLLPQLDHINGMLLDRLADTLDRYTFEQKPTSSQVQQWTQLTETPFDPLESLETATGRYVRCPETRAILFAPWVIEQGTGYAQQGFKLDGPPGAHNLITHETLGIYKLARDITRMRTSETVQGTLAGTLFAANESDALKSFLRATRIRNAVLKLKEINAPTASDVGVRLGWSQANAKKALSRLFPGPRQRALNNIISAYTRGEEFSLDLVTAVLRQGSFVDKMHDLGWTAPGRFDEDDTVLKRCVARYHAFLDLIASSPGTFVVPTLDIDLAWHSHQLDPIAYRDATIEKVGRFIDHDDKVEENALSNAYDITARAWQARFGVPYSICGCPLPSSSTLFNLTAKVLSTRVSNVPAPTILGFPSNPDDADATHPSEHNSVVLTSHPQAAKKRAQREKEFQSRVKRDEKKRAKGKMDEKDARTRDGHDAAFLYPVAFYPYYGYYGYPIVGAGCAAVGGAYMGGEHCPGTSGGGATCAVGAGACSGGGSCGGGGACGGGGGGGGGGCGGGGGGCGGGGGGGGGGCGGGGS